MTKRKQEKEKEYNKMMTLSDQEVNQLQKDFIEDLDNNVEYSLEVDPENKYDMSDEQKEFVKYYVQFKSIGSAAAFLGMDVEVAKGYYMLYSSQQEIRRINRALYKRQFATQLIGLDDLGGYLTSMLVGENTPLADRPIEFKDKIKLVDTILKVHELKRQNLANPGSIIYSNIDYEIKDLSLKTIKQLLNENNSNEEKNSKQIKNINLTPEELSYIDTLSGDDLLTLLETINKEGEADE